MTVKIIYNETKEIGVPESAVTIQGNTAFVYVINNDIALKKNIKIGKRNFGKVSIISGINEGDLVVSEGVSKVRDKTKIKILNQKNKMFLTDLSIKRPVVASVMSLVLVIFGLVTFQEIPTDELPDVQPPVVTIQTDYRGASAEIVDTQITQKIEDFVGGTPGLETMEHLVMKVLE